MWHTGLVAPWHVGSSWTRTRTHVPCIGRRILNHCATREAPQGFFYYYFLNGFFGTNYRLTRYYKKLAVLSPGPGVDVPGASAVSEVGARCWHSADHCAADLPHSCFASFHTGSLVCVSDDVRVYHTWMFVQPAAQLAHGATHLTRPILTAPPHPALWSHRLLLGTQMRGRILKESNREVIISPSLQVSLFLGE